MGTTNCSIWRQKKGARIPRKRRVVCPQQNRYGDREHVDSMHRSSEMATIFSNRPSRVWNEAHTRYTSSRSTVEWEVYTNAKQKENLFGDDTK